MVVVTPLLVVQRRKQTQMLERVMMVVVVVQGMTRGQKGVSGVVVVVGGSHVACGSGTVVGVWVSGVVVGGGGRDAGSRRQVGV